MAIDIMEWEEFGDYLLALGLHEDVVSNIVGNRIDGQLFISLSESEIKKLAPESGDRIRLRNILDEEWIVTNIMMIKPNLCVYFTETHG